MANNTYATIKNITYQPKVRAISERFLPTSFSPFSFLELDNDVDFAHFAFLELELDFAEISVC